MDILLYRLSTGSSGFGASHLHLASYTNVDWGDNLD